jgi:DNA-binding transcriptional ArsR family regulator
MGEYSRRGKLDHVFLALGDPTRRAILRGLARHPATINQIAKPFSVSLNTISKHVMVLERVGLVRREIRGREHHCFIDPRPLREADLWLEHYRQFWEQRLDALEAYVARKHKASKTSKRGAGHGRLN